MDEQYKPLMYKKFSIKLDCFGTIFPLPVTFESLCCERKKELVCGSMNDWKGHFQKILQYDAALPTSQMLEEQNIASFCCWTDFQDLLLSVSVEKIETNINLHRNFSKDEYDNISDTHVTFNFPYSVDFSFGNKGWGFSAKSTGWSLGTEDFHEPCGHGFCVCGHGTTTVNAVIDSNSFVFTATKTNSGLKHTFGISRPEGIWMIGDDGKHCCGKNCLSTILSSLCHTTLYSFEMLFFLLVLIGIPTVNEVSRMFGQDIFSTEFDKCVVGYFGLGITRKWGQLLSYPESFHKKSKQPHRVLQKRRKKSLP